MSKIYTKEELQAKVASTNPADRKEIGAVLQSHGKELAELVKMKPEERVKFILDAQAKAGKGKGAAAPAAGKGAVGAKAAVGTKKAVKPEPEAEEEPEPEEAEAEEAAAGGASGEDVAALSEKVDALTETVNLMAGFIAEIVPLIKETHHMTRAQVGLNGQEDEVMGLQETYYGQLMFPEADAGND